jgi:predicted MFS family arabinose efflux permease
MLQSIFAKSGFGWATRALGFVYLFLLAFANVLIRSRLPPKPFSRENVMPDLRMFKDLTLVIMTAGVFLIEWGMFMPITYITSFALRTGMRSSLAYQLLAIFNVGSFFGRWIPGHIADAIGRVKTTTLHIFLSMIATFVFWLPASLVSLSVSTPLIIVYAVVFGYSSGSNISLAPVCFGQLCKTEDYGRYMATCFTIVGFGMLVGIPIGGGILQADGGNYIGLICFTGACYTMGMIFFVWTRVRVVGWGIRSFY